jgi:truncated hemoglobin YjbI
VTSFYDQIGGMPTIRTVVNGFYAAVAADKPLRALYPESSWRSTGEGRPPILTSVAIHVCGCGTRRTP